MGGATSGTKASSSSGASVRIVVCTQGLDQHWPRVYIEGQRRRTLFCPSGRVECPLLGLALLLAGEPLRNA